MRNTFKILPVLTGDVSGAASALFELGGITAIHDPSGCNSTYNTHDETRWYNSDSMVFISGLNDVDAITGNDKKFIDAVTDAARYLAPNFISLANSPIPFLNGTDFEGIAKIITRRTLIPCFYVNTNACGDYCDGASKAFEAYVRTMSLLCDPVPSDENGKIRIGIIGATPLDFANPETMTSVTDTLEGYGFEVFYSMALGPRSYVNNCNEDNLISTDVNLVISSAGLAAAKVLEEKFNIPYVVGFPHEGIADLIASRIRTAFENKMSVYAYEDIVRKDSSIVIAGENVVATSIASSLKNQYGIDMNVISVTSDKVMRPSGKDLYCHTEDDFIEAFKDKTCVIADPLYKHVCPDNVKFIPLPHLAMSGRLYLKNIPDLVRFDPVKEGLL